MLRLSMKKANMVHFKMSERDFMKTISQNIVGILFEPFIAMDKYLFLILGVNLVCTFYIVGEPPYSPKLPPGHFSHLSARFISRSEKIADLTS